MLSKIKIKYFGFSYKLTRFLFIDKKESISIDELIKINSTEISLLKVLYPLKTEVIDTPRFHVQDFYNQQDKIITTRTENREHYTSEAIKLYQLKNVLIEKSQGTILMRKHKLLLKDSSYWASQFIFPTLHHLFTIKTLDSNSIFILNTNNYFHWFQEVLTRLFIIKQELPQATIYLSEKFNGWQQQAIEFFELNGLNYQSLTPKTNLLKSDTLSFLFISSHPEISHKDLITCMGAFLKNKLIRNANLNFPNIYISRKKAKHRRVLNEEELIETLKNQFKFEVICIEDYSVEQQYQLINAAKIIIAIHGPSLTNLISSTQPIVIELLNNKHLVECYAMLAFATNCTYKAIACENVGNSTGIVNGREFYGYNDMTVNIKTIVASLKDLMYTN